MKKNEGNFCGFCRLPQLTIRHLSMFCLFLFVALVVLMPDCAFAGSDFSDFENIFEKIEKFITGPVGKVISIAGMAACGIVYIFARQDLSEGFKLLLQVCFGICFIAFASSIVSKLFSFGSAMI